jgi:integrase
VTVYDRWHRKPEPGEKPCEHRDRAKGALYPSADHGKGMRWQVRYYDHDRVQQKRNFEHRGGGRNETDPDKYAVAYDAKVRAELNAGTYVDPREGEIEFEEYARGVVEARMLDPGTRVKMVQRLESHVYPRIGKQTLRALSKRPSLIQELVRSMSLAPSHVAVVMSHVSMILGVAVDDDLIGRNPVQSKTVTLPVVVENDRPAWTVDEIAAVRAFLAAEPPRARGRQRDYRRYAAVVDAGCGLGLRQGEIFGLSPDDIDWLRGTVTIRRQLKRIHGRPIFALPKRQKTRVVPLIEGTKRALARHMELYPPQECTLPWGDLDGKARTVTLMFTNAVLHPIHASSFSIYWRRAVEAAGLSAYATEDYMRENGTHELRKYFATTLISNGESIKAVSRWLGHASVEITLKRYLRYMPEESETRMRGILGLALYGEAPPSALPVPSGLRPVADEQAGGLM